MPWMLFVDSCFRMLRPYRGQGESFFDFAKSAAKCIVRKISLCRPNEPICLYLSSAEGIEFTSFTASVESLEKSIESLKPLGGMTISNPQAIIQTFKGVELQFNKFYRCHHSRLIIITDGESSDFLACDLGQANDEIQKVEDISCIFISLTDDKISPQLTQFSSYFRDTSTLSLNSILDQEASSMNQNDVGSLLATSLLEIQKCESEHDVFIACGHLFSLASLTPLPCFRHRTDLNPSELQLFVEIFGFLNSTDISHPPISSNHTILALPEQSAISPVTPDLLAMLLFSLTSTVTVAMVNVYLQEKVEHPGVLKLAEDSTLPPIYPDSRKFVTHGFIHRFNAKRDCLILSLFEEDCLGLPWLGQFAHLAPVADFSGSLLYNDSENITPFPVREAHRLSYTPPLPNDTDFQYLNWIHSPQGPTNDINKVLRLCKRLPEKSSLFFKELRRVKSAALAYGWPSLLASLRELLVGYLQESTTQSEDYLQMIDELLCSEKIK